MWLKATRIMKSERTHQHYGILLEEQVMAKPLAFHRQLASRGFTINSLESIGQMQT